MASYYEKLWVKDYGSAPTDDFLRIFGKITAKHIARALQKARERLSKGDKYPPHIGLLVSWCETPSESEYGAIIERVMSRDPRDDLEQWIVDRYGFNLRRMAAGDIERKIKQYYVTAVQLKRSGKIQPLRTKDTKKIDYKSWDSVTDRAVQSYRHSKRTHKFSERIEAIILSKRHLTKGEQG